MVSGSSRALAGLRGTGRLFAGISDALASVLFPADCRLCEELLSRATRIPICDECLTSFQRISESACTVCGMPLTAGTTEEVDRVCLFCRDKNYTFEHARSFALYEGAVIRTILLLKFERMEPLGNWFAGQLAEIFMRESCMEADVIVPVPLYRQRERERGYNQAELIAKPLAKRLGLPIKPILLVRTKPRPEKQVLSLEERWESVRGAFATRAGSQVDNRRVLLVDDVLTTGATLDACARALREAGAKSVVCLTVARTARSPVRSFSTS